MEYINNHDLKIDNQIENEIEVTSLALYYNGEILPSSRVTIKSNDSEYVNIRHRMDRLIKAYNSNHYNRELIICYFKYLKIGQSNLIYNNYNYKFDTLDLVDNKLVSVKDIIGATKSERVASVSFYQSDKYSSPTHTKGKFAGFTKAYIKLNSLSELNNYFYRGKSRYHVYDDGHDYISLFDIVFAKIDELSAEYNRFILAGCTGYKVLIKGRYYLDISHPTTQDRELSSCSKCNVLSDKLDGQNVCMVCREKGIRKNIYSYGHKPSAIFMRYWKGFKGHDVYEANFSKYHYFGIELEVELRNDTSQNMRRIIADEIMQITNNDGQSIFYCKDDSSLDNGFEIVSHPMTFRAWKRFDFAGLIYRYRKYIKSLKTPTAGMHIHVSRNAFSNLEALKVLRMTYEFPKFSMLISQRTASEQNSWASLKKQQLTDMVQNMVHFMKTKREISSYGIFNNSYCNATGGHRGAWNFQNSATAECRLFKGNLTIDGFYKNIEYVESMIQFVKTIGLHECRLEYYMQYVKQNEKRYPYLNKFLHDKKHDLRDIMKQPKAIARGLNT